MSGFIDKELRENDENECKDITGADQKKEESNTGNHDLHCVENSAEFRMLASARDDSFAATDAHQCPHERHVRPLSQCAQRSKVEMSGRFFLPDKPYQLKKIKATRAFR